MSALDKLLPPDSERLLWTAPYVNLWSVYKFKTHNEQLVANFKLHTAKSVQ